MLPIDLSHLQSVTLDRLIKSQFFPRHFESRGVGASFLRSTVTLSALSKGLVKRHGYRVKYPRSIPSLTVLDFLGREPSHVCKSNTWTQDEDMCTVSPPTACSSQLYFSFLVSAFMGIQQQLVQCNFTSFHWCSPIFCDTLWYSERCSIAGLMFYWWSPPSNSSEYQTAKPSHWPTDSNIPLEHAQATWKIKQKILQIQYQLQRLLGTSHR